MKNSLVIILAIALGYYFWPSDDTAASTEVEEEYVNELEEIEEKRPGDDDDGQPQWARCGGDRVCHPAQWVFGRGLEGAGDLPAGVLE